MDTEGTVSRAEGTAGAKVLGQDPVRSVKERRGGLCDWSRVNKGERGRRGGGDGLRADHAGPWGPRGGLGLFLRGRWEPWKG